MTQFLPAGPSAATPAPGTAWGGAAPTLLPPLRQALAAAPGQVALLYPPLPPRPRRALRLLLQEAARAGGGHLLEAAAGELLLLGLPAPAAGRAEAMAAELGLGAPAGRSGKGGGTERLLDWAAAAAPPGRTETPQVLAAEAAALQLPLERVVLRRTVLRLGPGVAPRRLVQRAVVSRRRLAAALGAPFTQDAELLEQAAERMEARLAEPGALPGVAPGLPLLLRPGPGAPPPPVPGAIPLLPLAAAAGPEALAARLAALGAAGWAPPAFDGLEAALLPLIDPAGLPPEGLLLLRWSPALGDRAAHAALRGGIDPARLVLTGCDGVTEALAWGLAAGLRHFAGPALEDLVGAARAA